MQSVVHLCGDNACVGALLLLAQIGRLADELDELVHGRRRRAQRDQFLAAACGALLLEGVALVGALVRARVPRRNR